MLGLCRRLGPRGEVAVGVWPGPCWHTERCWAGWGADSSATVVPARMVPPECWGPGCGACQVARVGDALWLPSDPVSPPVRSTEKGDVICYYGNRGEREPVVLAPGEAALAGGTGWGCSCGDPSTFRDRVPADFPPGAVFRPFVYLVAVVAMASPGPHEAAHRLGCLPPVPSPWLSGENWKLKGTKGRRDLPLQFCGLCGSIWKPPHDALNCDWRCFFSAKLLLGRNSFELRPISSLSLPRLIHVP